MKKSVLLLPLLALAAFAVWPQTGRSAEKLAQHWAQSPRTAIAVNQQDQRAAPAIGKVTVSNVTTDIRFDPRDLRSSSFLMGATFLPNQLPGGQTLSHDELMRAGSGMFFSKEIKKKKDNQFEATGVFKLNGREQPMVIPLFVTFDKNSTKPRLIFTGTFDAPIGQMVPNFGLPTVIPMQFYIDTDPTL